MDLAAWNPTAKLRERKRMGAAYVWNAQRDPSRIRLVQRSGGRQIDLAAGTRVAMGLHTCGMPCGYSRAADSPAFFASYFACGEL